MIFVTGATGQIGRELVQELSTSRAHFRALVRSAGKAEGIRAAGGEAVIGNTEDEAALRTALAGAERLFLLTPPDPGQPGIEARVVDAAVKAGVHHIVKLSAAGANAVKPTLLARLHRESEKHIEASGVPFTFLRPNFFMSNYLQFADTIQRQGAIYAPAGEGRHADIDVKDIAAVAARCLTEGDHQGRIYELTGPEALSLADGARKISKITGRDVQFVDVSPEDGVDAMTAAGVPEWFAEALVERYGYFLEGEGTTNGSAVTVAVEEVLDRPPRSFEQFVRENVRAFGG
jgi:uncharacterized protein YbjT (DUF2867 family)